MRGTDLHMEGMDQSFRALVGKRISMLAISNNINTKVLGVLVLVHELQVTKILMWSFKYAGASPT